MVSYSLVDQYDRGNLEWACAAHHRANGLRSTSTKLRMASFRLMQRKSALYCTHGVLERRNGSLDLIVTGSNVLVASAITKTQIRYLGCPWAWLDVCRPCSRNDFESDLRLTASSVQLRSAWPVLSQSRLAAFREVSSLNSSIGQEANYPRARQCRCSQLYHLEHYRARRCSNMRLSPHHAQSPNDRHQQDLLIYYQSQLALLRKIPITRIAKNFMLIGNESPCQRYRLSP